MQKKKSLNKKKRKTSDSAREVATPVINHGYPPIGAPFTTVIHMQFVRTT